MFTQDNRLPLAVRIKRTAFGLTMAVIVILVAVLMAMTLAEIPDNQRRANQSTVNVLGETISTDINNQLGDLADLSKSSLVWTSLSDSAGREAYLRPFLEARSRGPDAQPTLLLDYRARLVVGEWPERMDPAMLQAMVAGVIADRQPRLVLTTWQGRAQLLAAYPILYPYTQDRPGCAVSPPCLGPDRGQGRGAGTGGPAAGGVARTARRAWPSRRLDALFPGGVWSAAGLAGGRG